MARPLRSKETDIMFKLRHAFFNPLWRRAGVVAVCSGWGLVELMWGADLLWAVIFLGLAAVCAWVFFYNWQDLPDDD